MTGAKIIEPEELEDALDRVRAGTSNLYVPTHTHCTVIDKKGLGRWDKAGLDLLWVDKRGDIRMATGKRSVCLLRGQLHEMKIKKNNPGAQWEREFGSEFKVPKRVMELVDRGKLWDQSWGNDASPSFLCPETDKVLWVEHPDEDMREFETLRYIVTCQDCPGKSNEYDNVKDALEDVFTWKIAIGR